MLLPPVAWTTPEVAMGGKRKCCEAEMLGVDAVDQQAWPTRDTADVGACA
jgi:hypothetical protein